MFSSSDSIAIGHIHRGVRLETFGQATAGGAFKTLRGDALHGNSLDGVERGGFLSGGNLYFVQYMSGMKHMVVMGWFHHVVDGIVLVADAAEHEATDLIVKRDFIMSIGIGHHAFVDDLPIDIDARKWGALAVFGFFINGAFNKTLGKSAHGEGE